MDGFTRERYEILGNDTVVLSAGEGPPLVFFHGAGTFTGFAFAKAWAAHFRVLIPYHPGFGESAVDERMDSVQDYVMHYLELFDALGLEHLRLAGHSLGGWLAATLATQHPQRIERLALLAPIGLHVPEHPTADIFMVPPQELPTRLVANPQVLAALAAIEPDIEFAVQQYREMTTLARIAWERSYDLKLPRYLPRLRMPTLVLWGREDALVPVQQAEVWAGHIPGARLETMDGVGHGLPIESPQAAQIIETFMR